MTDKDDDTQKDTQTLVEFQAWLSGVEEMQDDDWTPTKTQWDKIRTRIAHVVADAPPAPMPMMHPAPMQMAPHMMPPAPGTVQQLPTPPPFVPPEYDISPAAAAMLSGNGKTPDVDASDGGVPSDFA